MDNLGKNGCSLDSVESLFVYIYSKASQNKVDQEREGIDAKREISRICQAVGPDRVHKTIKRMQDRDRSEAARFVTPIIEEWMKSQPLNLSTKRKSEEIEDESTIAKHKKIEAALYEDRFPTPSTYNNYLSVIQVNNQRFLAR